MGTRRCLGDTVVLLASLALAACSSAAPSDGGATGSDAGGLDAGESGDGAAPDAEAGDSGTGGDAAAGTGGDAATDAAGPDATSVDAGDAGDANPIEVALCPPENQVSDGCTTLPSGEGVAGLCDGLDNDCDGRVDDGCSCTPGETQPCFAGPPGRAGVGACARGTQVCQGFEFPAWGECVGGKKPADEQCDGIDNDCNGCSDELEQCANLVDCPLPGDPRIGTATPFSTHVFDADQFVDPALVQSYQWQALGTPCDRMFRSLPGGSTPYNGELSYTLRKRFQSKAELDVTLSGEYTINLQVRLINGEQVTCEFPFTVGAQGLRVELCWPESGANSPPSGEVDLDLHLGRAGYTVNWNDDEDCHWANCKTFEASQEAAGLWGAAHSPTSACSGALDDALKPYLTACPNPRLDVDSFDTESDRYAGGIYPTENINLDRVADGQQFRVAVVNRDCLGTPNCSGHVAHPLVNVYCDTQLAGSFELPAGEVDTFGAGNGGDEISGPRDVWRVVDILAHKQNGELDCELSPLTNDAGTGPQIEAGPDGGTLPY